MLWVLFNNKGQLINSYDTGNIAEAGTNVYEIFAVFQDIEVGELNDYSGGSIKLYKPDREHTSYLPLVMTPTSKVFDDTTNSSFTHGVRYSGLYFDFSQYPDIPLLDTTGLWRAVITLFNISNTSIRNVVGSVTFNVGNGIESEDGHDIDLDDLINDLIALCETKLNKNSAYYLKLIDTDNIEDFEFGNIFNANDIILNKYDKSLYKLDENKEPVLIGLKLSDLTDGTYSLPVADITAHSTIAPDYDATATYAVGDKVFYGGALYTCNTAITTAEAWNSEHWTAITVATGFVDLDKAQTISGVKTFATSPEINNNINLKLKGGNASSFAGIKTIEGNNQVVFGLYSNNGNTRDGGFKITVNALTPENSTTDLGASSKSWKDLWLGGAIKGLPTMTQTDYDNMATHDADTFYFIEEE